MDLAVQVEDYICSFQQLGDLEMDSLIMFVFIWALTVLLLLFLGKFLYQKYLSKKELAAQTTGSSTSSSSSVATGVVPSTPIITATSVTPLSAGPRSMGAATPSRGGGGRGVSQLNFLTNFYFFLLSL